MDSSVGIGGGVPLRINPTMTELRPLIPKDEQASDSASLQPPQEMGTPAPEKSFSDRLVENVSALKRGIDNVSKLTMKENMQEYGAVGGFLLGTVVKLTYGLARFTGNCLACLFSLGKGAVDVINVARYAIYDKLVNRQRDEINLPALSAADRSNPDYIRTNAQLTVEDRFDVARNDVLEDWQKIRTSLYSALATIVGILDYFRGFTIDENTSMLAPAADLTPEELAQYKETHLFDRNRYENIVAAAWAVGELGINPNSKVIPTVQQDRTVAFASERAKKQIKNVLRNEVKEGSVTKKIIDTLAFTRLVKGVPAAQLDKSTIKAEVRREAPTVTAPKALAMPLSGSMHDKAKALGVDILPINRPLPPPDQVVKVQFDKSSPPQACTKQSVAEFVLHHRIAKKIGESIANHKFQHSPYVFKLTSLLGGNDPDSVLKDILNYLTTNKRAIRNAKEAVVRVFKNIDIDKVEYDRLIKLIKDNPTFLGGEEYFKELELLKADPELGNYCTAILAGPQQSVA